MTLSCLCSLAGHVDSYLVPSSEDRFSRGVATSNENRQRVFCPRRAEAIRRQRTGLVKDLMKSPGNDRIRRPLLIMQCPRYLSITIDKMPDEKARIIRIFHGCEVQIEKSV